MPMTRQNTAQRGSRGRGGRGRGGRYGNRRRYNKKNYEKPVEKKEPIERCPYIVGTTEWGKWKQARYAPSNIYVGEPIDPAFIPKTFHKSNSRKFIDVKMKNLQQKMINNRWKLKEDSDGQYFEHDRYTGKRILVHNHLTSDGVELKLPIMRMSDDIEGLACDFRYTPPQQWYTIESNEFIDFFDTPTGKKRMHYLNYLDARMKKRAIFEKEAMIAAQKAAQKNLKSKI